MSNVNHPKHYNSHPSGVEAIDLCEVLSFNLGNALKYAWRAGCKGDEYTELEDLKKAHWYVRRELDRLGSKGGTVYTHPDDPGTVVSLGFGVFSQREGEAFKRVLETSNNRAAEVVAILRHGKDPQGTVWKVVRYLEAEIEKADRAIPKEHKQGSERT